MAGWKPCYKNCVTQSAFLSWLFCNVIEPGREDGPFCLMSLVPLSDSSPVSCISWYLVKKILCNINSHLVHINMESLHLGANSYVKMWKMND